jgi:hypothetical protein
MRIFIGFKWQDGDGNQQQVPVLYGDMNRQVANIIKENSENKMITVPKVACYITGLELDKSRLSDSSFISKVNIRERRYTEDAEGNRNYQQTQGGNYTVERLMPTPFKLTMKADIWTSNTDQKLQLMEQITVLFNPSLEIQTTDNYLDWTSLSVVNLENIQFSTRNIPQGVDTDIDVASMTFDMPIWITPPAKVKKLGIIQTVIANVFTESGDLIDLENLAFNQIDGTWKTNTTNFGVLLFKADHGNEHDYEVTIVDSGQAALSMGLDTKTIKLGEPIDWNSILEVLGGYQPNSKIYFKQPNGSEITGQFVVNAIDPSILTVSIENGFMSNTLINGRGTIDAIVDPYKFNPLTRPNGREVGVSRYLILDDIGDGKSFKFISEKKIQFINTEVNFTRVKQFKLFVDGVEVTTATSRSIDGVFHIVTQELIQNNKTVQYILNYNLDGPDAWKNLDGSDPVIKANSIIEWNGSEWVTVFHPTIDNKNTVIQNLKTMIKYRWDGENWLKAFEGEYRPGSWGLLLVS